MTCKNWKDTDLFAILDISIQISILFLDTNRRVDAPEITESDMSPCSLTTDSGTTNTCTPQIILF